VARVFATGRPTVSDLAVDRVTMRPTVFVFVPVLRGQDGAAAVRYAVGMPLLPERLSALLHGQAGSEEGAVTLTDGRGVIVARSREAERLTGQPSPPRADDEPRGESGVIPGRRVADGVPIRNAYHRVAAAPGWTVWVNEPEARFADARRGPLFALVGGGALALALGLALAGVLARRVLRPVDELVRHADAVAEGRVEAAEPRSAQAATAATAPVAEFEALRQAVGRAEAALRDGAARLRLALEEYVVLGVTTNLPLLRAIAAHADFAAGATNTDFLAIAGLANANFDTLVPPEVLVAAAIWDSQSAICNPSTEFTLSAAEGLRAGLQSAIAHE
jgi:HAMP domain-containing protein